MTNWVDHRLTITGPEMELKRFAACFIKAEGGELFPQYFADEFNHGEPITRPVGDLFFSFDQLVARPEDCDKWVLNRWGIQWVAWQGKIEVAAGEIKLAWASGWEPTLEVFAELAELFPLLTMEGGYSEYGSCIAGDVRCHGGKFTHVNKSEEFAAVPPLLAKIRELRKRWGITQDDLGFLLDLSRDTIIAAEKGRPRPMGIAFGIAWIEFYGSRLPFTSLLVENPSLSPLR